MKKIFTVMLITLLLCGCATSHLKNGEESVVKFKDGGISAEDLYELLKSNYGIEGLITLIDTELLSKEYEENDDEKTYISQVITSLKNEWGDEFLTNINSYYGVKTEKEFKEYVRLTYRRNLWLDDYAKSLVNDTQIEDYYEDVAIGDIEASHILIMSKATSSMSDDEKKEAENKALETAKDVIEKLEDGEKFEDLAKEYSDDSATKNNGGALGKFNYRDNYDKNFMDAAVKLETGEYTTEPVKSQYGYHIIYKTKQNDKPKLKEIKDEIINEIAEDLISQDSSLSTKAILALREKYDIKITDNDLKKDYNTQYNIE